MFNDVDVKIKRKSESSLPVMEKLVMPRQIQYVIVGAAQTHYTASHNGGNGVLIEIPGILCSMGLLHLGKTKENN